MPPADRPSTGPAWAAGGHPTRAGLLLPRLAQALHPSIRSIVSGLAASCRSSPCGASPSLPTESRSSPQSQLERTRESPNEIRTVPWTEDTRGFSTERRAAGRPATWSRGPPETSGSSKRLLRWGLRSPWPFGPSLRTEGRPMATAFIYRLGLTDGTPADPPPIRSAPGRALEGRRHDPARTLGVFGSETTTLISRRHWSAKAMNEERLALRG
jgi:hypothetical protein